MLSVCANLHLYSYTHEINNLSYNNFIIKREREREVD